MMDRPLFDLSDFFFPLYSLHICKAVYPPINLLQCYHLTDKKKLMHELLFKCGIRVSKFKRPRTRATRARLLLSGWHGVVHTVQQINIVYIIEDLNE